MRCAMASPNPIPPHPPIPPYRPQRSISGPLIHIAVGLVFLLATMHVLSLHNVWMWFGHYWPALLIVMLIVFGLIATQSSRMDWEALKNGMHIDDGDDWNWFEGHAYTYDDRLEQDFPVGGMLRVTDTRGAAN